MLLWPGARASRDVAIKEVEVRSRFLEFFGLCVRAPKGCIFFYERRHPVVSKVSHCAAVCDQTDLLDQAVASGIQK
jgi:hypothetical protein